jgi:hypothetical protein
MTLEPGEWKSSSDMTVKRVTKPIRMRVRRTCHRCQTTFGPNKVCVNCQHARCKKCPRHPPAKTQDHTETALHTLVAKGKTPAVPTKIREPPLTIPSRTGGQDLIRKPIRQRVRRTCHRCQTTFAAGATECASCHHTRCKICPRDPYVTRPVHWPHHTDPFQTQVTQVPRRLSWGRGSPEGAPCTDLQETPTAGAVLLSQMLHHVHGRGEDMRDLRPRERTGNYTRPVRVPTGLLTDDD